MSEKEYTLKASNNCGISYFTCMKSNDLKVLLEKGKELDEELVRWVIEDEEFNVVPEFCAIHKDIIKEMKEKGD